MDLNTELHAAAGLGALVLGAAALWRDPGRRRHRLFGLLCLSLAFWTLGIVANRLAGSPTDRWHLLYLLGSCAAAPLGLHYVMELTGRAAGVRGWLLPLAYGLAGVVWLSSDSGLRAFRDVWNMAATLILGGILTGALWLLVRHTLSRTPGPERDAFRLLLGGAAVAVVGGMSDFLPRDLVPLPKIGPVAVLCFLLVLCGLIVRHRFLDINVFLARVLALLTGAAAAGLGLYGVVVVTDGRPLPLFLAVVVVLAVAGPVGRALFSGAQTILGGGDPIARALMGVSQTLARAEEPAQVWRALDQGRRALSEEVRVTVFLQRGEGTPYRAIHRIGTEAPLDEVPADGPLPRLLGRELAPVTRRSLAEDAREGAPRRRPLAAAALAQVTTLDAALVVPLSGKGRLAGWIGIGGGRPEQYLTGEVAAAFLAVGHQAVESLARIEAVEAAKRREALAAAGEMAAGLAHEVRNPLGAIRGAAQVLEAAEDSRQAREMLEVIQEETARLGRVVGEFLAFARPAPPRREPVDLGALARQVLDAEQVAGTALQTRIDVAPDARPALGDADQLRRVFQNLARNAREAAGPAGSLCIGIAPDGAGRVTVRVTDDGPGIPEAERSRIFQPFHTTKAGGTGLGLALVHRIVEAHGGEITAETAPEAGAVFTMSLPTAEEQP